MPPKRESCAQKKMHTVMHEYKYGTLKSGKGGKGGQVKSRRQAIAIGMSEARKRCGGGSVSKPRIRRTQSRVYGQRKK